MRVRWGNVGRAAAVVGVLALAVAWPRLEGGAPRLPSDVAGPVAVPAPRGGNGSGEEGVRSAAADGG